jgi:glycerol transport system ATP-binding protein
VRFSQQGIPVRVLRVADAGRHQIVETRHDEAVIRLLLGEQDAVPAQSAHVSFDPAFTNLYLDGWLAGRAAS